MSATAGIALAEAKFSLVVVPEKAGTQDKERGFPEFAGMTKQSVGQYSGNSDNCAPFSA